MSLFEFIITLASGFVLGELVLSYRIKKNIKELLEAESLGKTILSNKERLFTLKVETINGTLYLWDVQSNEFVCQAKSLEELAQLSKQKNIKYAAVLCDNKQFVAFVDGAVTR